MGLPDSLLELFKICNNKKCGNKVEPGFKTCEICRYKSRELRRKVLFRLGNKCAKCGFSDYRALQIDHIHGGGVKEVNEIGRDKLYKNILEMEFPQAKYQCLCANCNWIKRHERGEIAKKNMIFNFDSDDIENLALVAYKEARGEGIDGCCAVMHVVYNRIGKSGFPKTLHDVIYQKNAFTSMSVPSDPEYNLQPTNSPIYKSCLIYASNVLSGVSDPTKGACYYANLMTMESNGWFERNISGSNGKGLPGHELTATIGQHSFYR